MICVVEVVGKGVEKVVSKYTTEVRFICEHLSGLSESVGEADVDQVIGGARPKIFDFNYPIFDDDYKEVLESKILMHYYTREIGFETVGLWKLKLNTKLNEIMPLYNQLYKSALLEFNPFHDTDLTTTHKGDTTGDKTVITDVDSDRSLNEQEKRDRSNEYNETNTNTGAYETGVDYIDTKHNEHEDNEWNLFSDTPQGGIDGIEAAYDGVSNNAYLTDARNIKREGASNDTNTGNQNTENTHNDTNVKNGEIDESANNIRDVNESVDTTQNMHELFSNTNEWVQKIFGKSSGVSYSKMLTEFRETFLNIDMMVIEELKDLFFLLW